MRKYAVEIYIESLPLSNDYSNHLDLSPMGCDNQVDILIVQAHNEMDALAETIKMVAKEYYEKFSMAKTGNEESKVHAGLLKCFRTIDFNRPFGEVFSSFKYKVLS